MRKRLGELIMSAVFVAVGLIAILVMQTQTSSALANTGATTFRTFPTAYGILIIALAGFNFISALLKGLKEDREAKAAGLPTYEEPSAEEKKEKRTGDLRTAGMFVLTLAMALLLKKVNFALLVFVFLFLSFFLLGQKKVWVNLIVAAVGSAVVYATFVFFLKLPL